ncbi:sigma-70 family RNA polymerase sigma factor [Nocardioides sp. NPDC047086]|uniref:RNA polymerase sigma factor n=1 Tax=Nocardioides sp. NPDC047086 TaxID=3154810 RepID=UPI0033CFAD00
MTEPAALEDLLRTEAPYVLSALVRRFGRFEAAEDAVQEALLDASTQWARDGVPENPRSWLTRIGYRRMVDLLRSEQAARRRELQVGIAEVVTPAGPAAETDDSLTLLLLCCHPALSRTGQVALTLRAVGGLTTTEIAHAYGVPENTMGTRISRAKQTLWKAGARFTPTGEAERADRIGAVLDVLYLVFNEGYTATAGSELGRINLAHESIRLTRMLARIAPGEPEVAGLLALMLLTEARRPARTDPDLGLVPLAEQDRSRWDRALIEEGLAVLEEVWGRSDSGPFLIQAAIAGVHAHAESAADTDWREILGLYLLLERTLPTAPVRLGRVVAAAHAFGPVVGLQLLDELDTEHGLADDPLTAQRVLAVRAHLLDQQRDPSAAAQFRAAANLTANEAERDYLLRRADQARVIVDS